MGTVWAHASSSVSPQLLAGPRFECAKPAVNRGPDKDQPAGCRDASADVQRARVGKPFASATRRIRVAPSRRHHRCSRRPRAIHQMAAPSTESSTQDSRSGRRRRPTGLCRIHVAGPPRRDVPCTIVATCPRFMTLVNTRRASDRTTAHSSCRHRTVLGRSPSCRQARRGVRTFGVHPVVVPQSFAERRVLGVSV